MLARIRSLTCIKWIRYHDIRIEWLASTFQRRCGFSCVLVLEGVLPLPNLHEFRAQLGDYPLEKFISQLLITSESASRGEGTRF